MVMVENAMVRNITPVLREYFELDLLQCFQVVALHTIPSILDAHTTVYLYVATTLP